MSKSFAFSFVLLSAFTLSACDKTSEDHARDAQSHAQNAQEYREAGKNVKAGKESTEAKQDQSQANAAAANEGRNAPPDSAVPGYIKPK